MKSLIIFAPDCLSYNLIMLANDVVSEKLSQRLVFSSELIAWLISC